MNMRMMQGRELRKSIPLPAKKFDTAVVTSEPMAAYDKASDPVNNNQNYTSLALEYEIRDGEIKPTCLRVYNNDWDPDGEEPEGSEAEKREINHYAQVLNCVAAWLLVEEQEKDDDDVEKDEEGTRDEGKDSPAREDLGDLATAVAGLENA